MVPGPVAVLFGLVALSGIALCWLGVDSYRRWDEPGLRAFVVTVLGFGIGAVVGGGLGLAGGTGSQSTLWQVVLLSTFFLASIGWVVFAFQYTGQWTRPSRGAIAVLALPAVAGVVATSVNYLTQLQITSASSLGVPGAVLSAVYAVSYMWVTALVVVGAFLLVRTTRVYGHLSVGQGVTLSLAALSTVLAGVFYNALTALAGYPGQVASYAGGVVVSTLCFVVAVRHYDTFEATPAVGSIGREAATQEIDDLVVVTDHRERVIEANEAVAETLGVDTTVALGEPVVDLLGVDVETLQTRETVELHTADGHRTFDARVSGLTDQHDRWLGSLVSLRDVTDRQIRRQRLEVLNRVLRHNLRNKLTVIRGTTHAIAESGDHPDHTRRILDATTELSSISERAKAIEKHMAVGDSATGEVRVLQTVEDVVAEVRESYPDVSFRVDGPQSLVVTLNEGLLRRVLFDAVQNAAEHNDSPDPRVDISVAVEENADHPVRLTVSDNGPGIPEHELDVLRSGTETALEHGSSLGLWAITWGTRQLRGTLSFERDGGTTVRIELPHTPLPTDPDAAERASVVADGDGRRCTE